MKKIFACIALACSLGACSLEETPYEFLTEEEAYRTSEMVYINAVIGIYTDIRNLARTDTWDLNELTTDEAILPTRGSDWDDGGLFRSLFQHTWTPSQNQLFDTWSQRYTAIGKCNQSLKIIEKAKASNPGATFYDAYIAEVKAVRALNYFYLLDQFGRVPISTLPDVTISEVRQSKRSEVFNFVKEELDNARPHLIAAHSNKPGEYYGRMTKSTAFFLLAKLALNAKVYTDDNWQATGNNPQGSTHFTIDGKEVGAYQAVIAYADSIAQEGYELEMNFSANFSTQNEGSNENIFTIPLDPNAYNLSTQVFNQRNLHYLHGRAYGMSAYNGQCATIEMMKAMGYGMENADPRLSKSFYTGKVVGPNGSYIKEEDGITDFAYRPMDVRLKMEVTEDPDIVKKSGARWAKYELDRQFQGGGDIVHNDFVIARYADVLLMKAEALLRLGNSGEALSLVNDVRHRVNAPALETLTPDGLLEERMVELSWEMWRRNDMIRFGTFTAAHIDKEVSAPYRIVFPIHQNILSSNQNLTQNPGYDK